MSNQVMPKYSIVDLFAGAGGQYPAARQGEYPFSRRSCAVIPQYAPRRRDLQHD